MREEQEAAKLRDKKLIELSKSRTINYSDHHF